MRVNQPLAAAFALAIGATALSLPSASAAQDTGTAQTTPFKLVEDRDVNDRLAQPEDRYALAGGCYAVTGAGVDGEPLHFQATDLGTYLVVRNEGPDTSVGSAWWDERSYLGANGSFASAPGPSTEWVVTALGGDPDARNEAGQPYAMASGSTSHSPVIFTHVPDDNPGDDDANGTACASWPEVQTNTSGAPAPTGRGPADRVEGFFEAHIHGMAYEFLGGELRCGQPWHKYGVEYALPDCRAEGKAANGALEVGLAGQNPADPFTTYDPVGWPTFNYWPKHDTLTHEAFYWKWLERAHHGGLRIFTNLFVENSALCEAYPLKQNSCNEMDSVRLQAIRIHELQDYIDAQYGGPGEGWFRIVTDPSQARAVINDGRLAVVLGIEVSELFDCRAILDVPQCTPAQVDERLAEAYDMGVRQMELLNKFDSALAGVTGDGGSTGIVVNQGNRKVTQHYWNMVTCTPVEETHGHEGDQHDKYQSNVVDDSFGGNQADVDALAGLILNQFGALGGAGAPAYPPGPHCNTRGLTDLGRQVIRGMYERGMIFDPDHMSASSMREAMDFIEDVLVPEEAAKAKAEGRQPVTPSIISSHSWGNDVIYQRIFENDGHVAPRTAAADSFIGRWQQRRAWWEELAPDGAIFGMGYGADTNGLGGQPGPRDNPAVKVDYVNGWDAPIGDVKIFQQTSGVKTFDVNEHGVAHYGLFADWFRELWLSAEEKVGPGAGDRIITDMLNGAEDYLRMWERNVYGANECVEDGSFLQVEDVHALIGQNYEGYQRAIGSPAGRTGPRYTYCTENGPVDVIFDAAGNAVEVIESLAGLTPEDEPDPEPEPAPEPTSSEAAAPTPEAADHTHTATTGGGLAGAGALLLGMSGMSWSALRRRRD